MTTIIRVHPTPAANFTCSSNVSIPFRKASSSPRVGFAGRFANEIFSFNSANKSLVESSPSFSAAPRFKSVPRYPIFAASRANSGHWTLPPTSEVLSAMNMPEAAPCALLANAQVALKAPDVFRNFLRFMLSSLCGISF